MTAMAELRPRSSSLGAPRWANRSCKFEEPHPHAMKNSQEGRRSEERCRALPITFENITEAEEEPASTSECSSSSSSVDGRSPYAMRPEDRYWFCSESTQTSFYSHPLISPKFARRCTPSSPNRLQRGFSDPVVRRKRSLTSLADRLTGGSFDQFSSDVMNLPPIPEVVDVRSRPGQSKNPVEVGTAEEEEETDYDDSSECSDYNGSV